MTAALMAIAVFLIVIVVALVLLGMRVVEDSVKQTERQQHTNRPFNWETDA